MAIVKISVEKVTKLHHMSVLMHTIIVISSVIPVRDDLTDPVYPYAQSRADIVAHIDLMMRLSAVCRCFVKIANLGTKKYSELV